MMMLQMARSFAVPLSLGACVGAIFGTGIEGYVVDTYYSVSPVITATWSADKLPDGSFAVRFEGVKHKPCLLESVWGYDVTPDGVRTRLKVQRPDQALSRDHRTGPFRGTVPWVVIPPPVGKLEISFEHRCDGRTVLTPVRQA